VTVLQADGLYEIEKGISPGNAGDFWTAGKKLGPGTNWPNTAGYSSGIVKQTGITIEVMTKSQFIMLIRVTGL
jgi:hypothetical protein